MAQKFFKANLPKLESLRIARGFSMEKLAEKAIISPRTLNSIKAGKPAAISTFSKLAKALDTPVESILLGYEEPTVPEERLWTVTITVSTPFKNFDETRDLPVFLSRLLSKIGGADLAYPEAKSGSTKISVALTAEQVLRLVSSYISGDLDRLGVKRISVPVRVPEGSQLPGVIETSEGQRIVLRTKRLWLRRYPELLRAIRAAFQASRTGLGDL